MRCYHCDAEARGVCRFCGSGLCRDHARSARFVSGITFTGQRLFVGADTVAADYVVVDNALWCGRCAATAHRAGR